MKTLKVALDCSIVDLDVLYESSALLWSVLILQLPSQGTSTHIDTVLSVELL